MSQQCPEAVQLELDLVIKLRITRSPEDVVEVLQHETPQELEEVCIGGEHTLKGEEDIITTGALATTEKHVTSPV